MHQLLRLGRESFAVTSLLRQTHAPLLHAVNVNQHQHLHSIINHVRFVDHWHDGPYLFCGYWMLIYMLSGVNGCGSLVMLIDSYIFLHHSRK